MFSFFSLVVSHVYISLYEFEQCVFAYGIIFLVYLHTVIDRLSALGAYLIFITFLHPL